MIRDHSPACGAAAAALALTLLLACMPMPAQAAASEAQVKAAYLYKLASFVRWPVSAFTEPTSPLRICVAGRDDVRSVVAALSRGQSISGRSILTETVDAGRQEGAAMCHILFVGRGETSGRSLLSRAGSLPILTVTDRSSGTRGGMIEFFTAGGAVRFMIHRRAAEARELVISSKLLAVAASVE